MDIAVLSDIHGNYDAFATCVEYVLKRNITRFLFLGDYVGEFGFPQKTMELLYEMKEKYDCTFIKGNKEDYWLFPDSFGRQSWKEYDSVTGALFYTYHNLTDRDLAFFSSLDIAEEIQLPGLESFTICHGSPARVGQKLLPGLESTYEVMEQCKTRLILCGHTHIQGTIEYHGSIEHQGARILNPGSVGTPFLSGGKAQFLILHGTENGWQEEFISLSHDVEKEVAELRRAGLDRRAPYWYQITVKMLYGGGYTHGTILGKAMQLCEQELGSCNWPHLPEKYMAEAYRFYYGEPENF